MTLDPVNERLQPSDRIDVGLAGRIPEVEFLDGPLLGNIRMSLKDLLISQILAYSSINLIQYSELNRLLIIDFDVFASLYRPFQSASQNG